MSRSNSLLPSWYPLGLALQDYLAGRHEAAITVILEDARRDVLPAATLFRVDGFPDVEQLAMELAKGRLLDAGAGAGPHSLELQKRGFEVVALDVCAEAVHVMRQRGVREAYQGDLFNIDIESLGAERFDTILLMMNGLGLASDLPGLRRLLVHLHSLLAEDGSILVDSSDLRLSDEPRELRLIEEREKTGRYFGVARMQMAYEGLISPPFSWLYVDLETLTREARPLGWHVQSLFEDSEGPFLARLSSML